MFPHTITIFRHSQDLQSDTYIKHVLKGVYWYGNGKITVSGNGVNKQNNINIIVPKEHVDTFKIEWDIKEKDYVVLGEVEDIESVKDLKVYDDVITVISIDKNICNSELDNIVIVGN